MSQSLTRRVTKRIMQYIRDGFRIKTKKTKDQERIVELEKQLVQAKKEKNSLGRRKWQHTKGWLLTFMLAMEIIPSPPTDMLFHS